MNFKQIKEWWEEFIQIYYSHIKNADGIVIVTDERVSEFLDFCANKQDAINKEMKE